MRGCAYIPLLGRTFLPFSRVRSCLHTCVRTFVHLIFFLLVCVHACNSLLNHTIVQSSFYALVCVRFTLSMCDSSLSRRWYLSHIRSQEGEIMCSVCPSEKSLLDKY